MKSWDEMSHEEMRQVCVALTLQKDELLKELRQLKFGNKTAQPCPACGAQNPKMSEERLLPDERTWLKGLCCESGKSENGCGICEPLRESLRRLSALRLAPAQPDIRPDL